MFSRVSSRGQDDSSPERETGLYTIAYSKEAPKLDPKPSRRVGKGVGDEGRRGYGNRRMHRGTKALYSSRYLLVPHRLVGKWEEEEGERNKRAVPIVR